MLSAAQHAARKPATSGATSAMSSRALKWLWDQLRDVGNPQLLDCGPVFQSTLDVLLARGAKLYLADLISTARASDPKSRDGSRALSVFPMDDLLARIPEILPESLSAVFCWHLFDLIPSASLPDVVERMISYLKPGGALFCLLREPYLPAGAETAWWLHDLTVIGSGGPGQEIFPHPALTNREMERLAPACVTKTFLTRVGRREVLAIKQ